MNAILGFVVLSVLSFSANAQKAIRCLDGGGYYGTVTVSYPRADRVRIDAAQGFAYELSSQLGASKGREASDMAIEFVSARCKSQNRVLRCADKVIVNPKQFSYNLQGYAADVEFVLDTRTSRIVAELKIRPVGSRTQAKVSHIFEAPMGGCTN